MLMDKIYPTDVDIKYNTLNIDGIYVLSMAILKIEINIQMFDTLRNILEKETDEVIFHIERQNSAEVLKKLTNIISENAAELKSTHENRIDVNVLDDTKNKAIELRKKIQIDSEQIYLVSIYLVLKEIDEKSLWLRKNKIINLLYSKRIIAKPCNFRQKEAYIATLPITNNIDILKKHTNIIFTEKALTNMFPFYTEDVLKEEGIIVGKANGSLCSIDIFGKENNNYNVCVFGASGAGKSYFVKLMIIKYAYKGIRQIIIDPEGEYVELVKALGGQVIDINTYNPFYIEETFTLNEDFLDVKIEQIKDYLYERFKINPSQYITECIRKTYSSFGINNKRDSLYIKSNGETMYIKPRYTNKFPNLKHFLNVATKLNEIVCEKIKENIQKKEDVAPTKSNIYCFNLKGLNKKQIQSELKIYIPKIYELIHKETLIYFDEVWKCIIGDNEDYATYHIYNMYKTLRKNKAGIVIISQDINDLFSLENGAFGKSILNNSNNKIFFKMDWSDVEILERLNLKKNIIQIISGLTKGEAFFTKGNVNFKMQVRATDYEHDLIERGKYEKSINSSR